MSGVAAMQLHIQLHLTDAIDNAYRVQSFTHVMTTGAAPFESIAFKQTYAFTTQSSMNSPGASTYLSSNVSGDLNNQPSAKRHKSSLTAC